MAQALLSGCAALNYPIFCSNKLHVIKKKNATFCELSPDLDPSTCSLVANGDHIMTNSNARLKRRISVATCWATTRMAVLDNAERYEDSYAITQEFREWITCLGEHPEKIEDSTLSVPIATKKGMLIEHLSQSDEMLEI
ncbi:MAG: Uncharacterised protein [Prochlorococcus marinus str. MIT 9215]|nr:MAG: Uncharacterised protein [Prochlorococcus marinus str. MIT 9215]